MSIFCTVLLNNFTSSMEHNGIRTYMCVCMILLYVLVDKSVAFPLPTQATLSKLIDDRLSHCDINYQNLWKKKKEQIMPLCNTMPNPETLNSNVQKFAFNLILCSAVYDSSIRLCTNVKLNDAKIIDDFEPKSFCHYMGKAALNTSLAENKKWFPQFSAAMKNETHCNKECVSDLVNPLCALVLVFDYVEHRINFTEEIPKSHLNNAGGFPSVKEQVMPVNAKNEHSGNVDGNSAGSGYNSVSNTADTMSMQDQDTKLDKGLKNSYVNHGRKPIGSSSGHPELTEADNTQINIVEKIVKPTVSTMEIRNESSVINASNDGSSQVNKTRTKHVKDKARLPNATQANSDNADRADEDIQIDSMTNIENSVAEEINTPNAKPASADVTQEVTEGSIHKEKTIDVSEKTPQSKTEKQTPTMIQPSEVGSAVVQKTTGKMLVSQESSTNHENNAGTAKMNISIDLTVPKIEEYNGIVSTHGTEDTYSPRQPDNNLSKNRGGNDPSEGKAYGDDAKDGQTQSDFESDPGTDINAGDEDDDGDDVEEKGNTPNTEYESAVDEEPRIPANINISPNNGLNSDLNKDLNGLDQVGVGLIARERFVETEDSHFFAYFMTMIILCIIGYLIFHNKQKILALALEGRARRGTRRRPNTSSYRKLDSNLEEAITSGCSSTSVTHVIY